MPGQARGPRAATMSSGGSQLGERGSVVVSAARSGASAARSRAVGSGAARGFSRAVGLARRSPPLRARRVGTARCLRGFSSFGRVGTVLER